MLAKNIIRKRGCEEIVFYGLCYAIIKTHEAKKELEEQVLSGEGMNVGSFTKEQLLELLNLDQ